MGASFLILRFNFYQTSFYGELLRTL